MFSTWQSLLADLAIVAVVVSIWTQIGDRADRKGWIVRDGVFALLFGGGVLAVMAAPFEIRPGVFGDLRTAMVVLSGFFGGPLVGVAVFLTACFYRVSVGGLGAPSALIGLSFAVTIGIAGNLLLGKRSPNYRDAFGLAFAGAGGSLCGFAFLPPDVRAALFPDIAPAIATITFVAVAVAGVILVGDIRRREVSRQNRFYAAILDALPNPLNLKDREGHFLAANPATAALLGARDANAVKGRTDYDFFPPETAARLRDVEEKLLREGTAFAIRQQLVLGDGREAWLSTTKAPFRDRDGNLVGIITHNRDITESAQLEKQYELTQRRLTDALANMADGLAMFDHEGRIIMCNPQYARLFPKTADIRVPGATLEEILRAGLVRGEERLPPHTRIEDWIADTVAALWISADTEFQLGDGRWLQARVRPSEDGTSLTVVSEVTAAKTAEAALVEVNAKLDALARTDGLTGLLNRRAFDEALAREFARSVRVGRPLSLFIADVDCFKIYNDTYGHPEGDACLKAVGFCLASALKRPTDVGARYGGEEFVALLPDTDASGALIIAETFRQAVRALAITHSGSEKGRVTVTIGVATSGNTAVDSPAILLQTADEALYEGKTAGRDRTVQSAPELDGRARLVAG